MASPVSFGTFDLIFSMDENFSTYFLTFSSSISSSFERILITLSGSFICEWITDTVHTVSLVASTVPSELIILPRPAFIALSLS